MKHGIIETPAFNNTNPTNLLSNGDFECWSAGTDEAPDGWTYSTTGGTITRESTIVKIGTYSAKSVKISGTVDRLAVLNLHTEKGIAYWQGRALTFSMWVWCDTASSVRLQINDGVTNYYSSYHTGGSGWELLSRTATINAAATTVGIYTRNEEDGAVAYFDGAMLVEGESAFAFSPKPIPIEYLDTDGTLTSNSDTKIASQKATKTYADTKVIAPASNTADKVPQWNGVDSKTLKDGLTVGTGASNLVQLDSSSRLPAVNGSLLTNLPTGSWASISRNTVYRAATDGFVVGFSGYDSYLGIYAKTDSNATPSTTRQYGSNTGSWEANRHSITMPVRKNDYYYVYSNKAVGGLYWIPLS